MKIGWAIVPVLVLILQTPALAMERWSGGFYAQGETACTPVASPEMGANLVAVCPIEMMESGLTVEIEPFAEQFGPSSSPDALLPTVYLALYVEEEPVQATISTEEADIWYDIDKFEAIDCPEVTEDNERDVSSYKIPAMAISFTTFFGLYREAHFNMPSVLLADRLVGLKETQEILVMDESISERIEDESVVWTLY